MPAADPTDDPSADAASAGADTTQTVDDSSGTLPFTGFQLLSMLLVAGLFVLAGAGLRRAVRRA